MCVGYLSYSEVTSSIIIIIMCTSDNVSSSYNLYFESLLLLKPPSLNITTGKKNAFWGVHYLKTPFRKIQK